MNKTLNINLAGLIFHIDEDAFKQLERYLETLKRQFRQTEGGNEIISDIEHRIAELFRERTSESKEVINHFDVLEVIGIMGQPEDYIEAEEGAEDQVPTPGYIGSKRLMRDPDRRVIGGVAAGVAAYFNVDAVWIRLLFVLLFFTGPGFLVYLIMWIVIPRAKTTTEKLMMRGEPVNISNIQRSIKDEFTDVRSEYRYGRTRDGIGGFFNELGRFIADAFRLIFKFIFKIIGFFLLFIGFIMLFSIVMSLIVGSVDINGSDVSLQYALELLQLITENDNHYNMLIVSIILSVAAPLFLLIYFGIRILFNLDPLNRPTRSGLGLVTLIGLVLLVVSSVRIAHEFNSEGDVSYKVNLPEHQQYFLTGLNDSISTNFDDDYHVTMHWLPMGNAHAFNLVSINILSTEEAAPFVMVRRKSQGPSRSEARSSADDLMYEVTMEDSVIVLPIYYLLGENQKFRAQEVEVEVFLPAGHSIYLDHSLQEYLYGVDNLQNMWDEEMVGKLWHMTEKGLSCDNCEIPGNDFEMDDTTDQDEGGWPNDTLDKTESADEEGDLVFFDFNNMEQSESKGKVFCESISRNHEEQVRIASLNILRQPAQLRI